MNLFLPNTDILNSFFDKAKYLMAWRITLTFCAIFLILIAINSLDNTIVFAISIVLFSISSIALVYLKVYKKIQPYILALRNFWNSFNSLFNKHTPQFYSLC